MHFLTTLTRAALVGGLLAGAAAPSLAQDGDLVRRIREEVMRELRPEFEKLEKQQRDRLWAQFEKLVAEKVAERVAEEEAKRAAKRDPVPGTSGGKPVMGISVQPTTAGVNALLDLGETGGLSVRSVVKGGPADQAGLKVGDVITKIGGKRLGDLDALRSHLKGRRAGDADEVEFLRQGKAHTVEFVYGGTGGTAGSGSAGDAATRVAEFLKSLDPSKLAQIERILNSVEDPTDRAEMLRMAVEKLSSSFDGATRDDLAELRRALKMGTRVYLQSLRNALRNPQTRAEALERLLNGMLQKDGRSAKSVEKLLDDILGEGGKKPSKPDTPEQPEAVPSVDPEAFQKELQRVKERIERDGFPQDDAGVGAFLDTILKNIGLTRPQVRNLIQSMGGPAQAKGIVRMQIQQLGITLTEDDLDRVMKVIMDDGAAGGTEEPAARAKAGRIGCRLKPEARGAKVQSVSENSPAAKAGLRPGDLVISFGGKSVTTLDNVKAVLAGKFAGDTIEIEVERNGSTRTLTLKLEARE